MKLAYLVEQGENPSSDFFVIPKLISMGYKVTRCSHDQLPLPEDLNGHAVVFVRYIPKRWKPLITNSRTSISELIFFMDDDLFSFRAFKGMPLRYQWKIFRNALMHKGWLAQMKASFWMSTPYLVTKYASLQPSLISAQPVEFPIGVTTIFYHGSASHIAEMNWLLPIIKKVLVQRPNVRFELIGNPAVYKKFRAVDRVHVLMPMNWVSYKSLLCTGNYDIGLAPLLDNSFNSARSHTKFFDITSAGAVGLYANHPAYSDVINHEENGFLLAIDEAVWEKTLLSLIDDQPLRKSIYNQALIDCKRGSV
ncbi:glycosyltransferase family 1 protein [Neptunomonas phycophila]|uniref:glycosyltransferase family 1 protein n=1 Tax=Neptunomonas phycophila TaxID=1572645 RepID=UPI0026E44109|nr:glycosyltransferase family 1 protein [Neptunomonas phycophila]MDO6782512.1 glycosyltransferase family 1 protein [Neptunomonas phycophila]